VGPRRGSRSSARIRGVRSSSSDTCSRRRGDRRPRPRRWSPSRCSHLHGIYSAEHVQRGDDQSVNTRAPCTNMERRVAYYFRIVADAGWKLRGAKTIEMLICMKI
jgi:hypothetical protein